MKFLRSKEFKIFFTIWIVYIFYLQMFGSSTMANTQSALTASLVNEFRFEIDTYHMAGGEGNSFYNDHYYSGQAPGISFISVPLYFILKPVFYVIPENAIDFLFEKLENHGSTLMLDFEGKERKLSNYFPDLDKRKIIEYVFIAGFILPIFTTSLFSALGSVILYLILKRITKNELLRMSIVFFYAFGSLIFPLSTEFFERPIAIFFMLAAFFVAFRINKKEIKQTKSDFFLVGILAGFSVWFDYFHILGAMILFFYLAYPLTKKYMVKNSLKYFSKFRKKEFPLLLSLFVGIFIPVFLLTLYHFVLFDSFFATSYTHREYSEHQLEVSGLENFSIPDKFTIFSMLEIFIYYPLILLALYGVFLAIRKRNRFSQEAVFSLTYFSITLIFSSLLTFSYISSQATFIAFSFKRYLIPMLPFIYIFLPYIFKGGFNKSKLKTLFLVFGVISVLMAWTSAQYGGHWALSHFDLENNHFRVLPNLLEVGPSSSFLTSFSSIFGMNSVLVNFIGLLFLLGVIFFMWKK